MDEDGRLSTIEFGKLFAAARSRWLQAPREDATVPSFQKFTDAVAMKATKSVENWCAGKAAPPKATWARVKTVLEQHGNSAAQIAALDRVWREAKGLPTASDAPAGDTPSPAWLPAPWMPADDHYRRIDGFADIDAHPPEGETAQGVFALRVSATLGAYKTVVPDAPDGQAGFPVTLGLTGLVEIVAEAKGGVQRVPGTEQAAAGQDPKISFAGGAWTLDVSNAPDPASLLTNAQLCDMRRFGRAGQVEVDLRCLPMAIAVGGIPADLPTTAQAVLRRLHQFADANTENDRIVLAWSRIARSEG